MLRDFYKNKKVLVTGHTGFKGAWLSLWLHNMGAEVCGYSLAPNTSPALFEELNLAEDISGIIGDIRDSEKLAKAFADFKPDIVFHLAAQPLVRLSYFDPLNTYETNVIGSLKVLEAARKTPSVRAFVNVTTDKCYENKEVKRAYVEEDAMGGYDMYSSSKGCVEIMSSSYRRSFLDNGYAMATARAGNVIGGGDWAPDRLIPDCIRSFFKGEPVVLRYPNAVRPWEHVLEPLSGYLMLAEKLWQNGKDFAEGFNFGPGEESFVTVEEIVQKIIAAFGCGELIINQQDNLHEAGLLMLNVDKAKKRLGWEPTLNIDETVAWTLEWYRHFYNKDTDIKDFSVQQIKEYEHKSEAKK